MCVCILTCIINSVCLTPFCWTCTCLIQVPLKVDHEFRSLRSCKLTFASSIVPAQMRTFDNRKGGRKFRSAQIDHDFIPNRRKPIRKIYLYRTLGDDSGRYTQTAQHKAQKTKQICTFYMVRKPDKMEKWVNE